jgi:hypothetical protein
MIERRDDRPTAVGNRRLRQANRPVRSRGYIGDRTPDISMTCAYANSQGSLIVQDDALTLTTAGLRAVRSFERRSSHGFLERAVMRAQVGSEATALTLPGQSSSTVIVRAARLTAVIRSISKPVTLHGLVAGRRVRRIKREHRGWQICQRGPTHAGLPPLS